jgi:hypothetical protein
VPPLANQNNSISSPEEIGKGSFRASLAPLVTSTPNPANQTLRSQNAEPNNSAPNSLITQITHLSISATVLDLLGDQENSTTQGEIILESSFQASIAPLATTSLLESTEPTYTSPSRNRAKYYQNDPNPRIEYNLARTAKLLRPIRIKPRNQRRKEPKLTQLERIYKSVYGLYSTSSLEAIKHHYFAPWNRTTPY